MLAISSLMIIVFGTVIFLCAWYVARNMARQKLRLDTALNNMSQGLCMYDREKKARSVQCAICQHVRPFS
jgi:hypothetical protein